MSNLLRKRVKGQGLKRGQRVRKLRAVLKLIIPNIGTLYATATLLAFISPG